MKQGWLERLAQGLYRRPFGPAERSEGSHGWKIPLLSAQLIMGYQFHVGGATALFLHGHSHYLGLGRDLTVHLYGADIPAWLPKLRDGQFVRHGTALFGEDATGIENATIGLTEREGAGLALSPWHWPLRVSSPERAILEMLDELPAHDSFHSIDTIFEGLVNLRPKLLTPLLLGCRSVKVKRLFFVYADRHTHAWRRQLDSDAIDLGKGDRALVPGGRLHPTYRITVPADLLQQGAADGA